MNNGNGITDHDNEGLEFLTAEGSFKQTFFQRLKSTTQKVSIIALPILVTNATTTTNNFVGASIASNIGTESISSAASAIIFPVQVSLIVVFSAPLFAIPVIMQRHVESGNDALVGNTVMQGMKLSVLLCVLPSILSFFTGDLFELFGTPSDVASLINNYFDVFCFVLPIQLIAFSMQQAAIGLSKTRLLISVSVLNTFVTLGSAYVFSKGFFGLFEPSNSSVAYGFLAGGLLRTLFYGCSFKYSNTFKRYHVYTLDNLKNNTILKDIWKTGWPFGLQLVSELISINMLAVIANRLPDKIYGLDILNVMNQYNLFSVIIPIGLSEASAVLISKACEKKSYKDVRLLGNNVLFLGLIYNLMLVILGIAMPQQLASVFIDPDIASGENGLSGNLMALFTIVFLGLTLNSGRDITTGSLRPLGIVKSPMYASYIALWLFGLPLAYALSIPLNMGIAGTLIGYYLGTSAGTVFMLGKWISNSRESKVQSILEADPSHPQKQSCLDRVSFFVKNCFSKESRAPDFQMIDSENSARDQLRL